VILSERLFFEVQAWQGLNTLMCWTRYIILIWRMVLVHLHTCLHAKQHLRTG
jgi:hypothetical protein